MNTTIGNKTFLRALYPLMLHFGEMSSVMSNLDIELAQFKFSQIREGRQ